MREDWLNFGAVVLIALKENDEIAALSAGAEDYLGQSENRLKGQKIGDVLPNDHPILLNRHRVGHFTLYDQRYDLPTSPYDIFDLHQMESENGVNIFLYPKPHHHDHDWANAAQGALRQTSGMADMLAHEIRNPLGAIRGAAQLLKMDAKAEDVELLSVIEEESARIGRMVNAFEDMAGKTAPNIEAVNVHLVINQVLRAARAGFARDIQIIEAYDPSLPEIAADKDRLQRALTNILKNASEAIRQRFAQPDVQGRIQVQTRYRSGMSREAAKLPVEISISDNGGGIDQALIDDVFQPFVTTKTNGTGLGLSMVARIVEDLSGVIEIENANQGCVFRILLPIWRE